MKKIVRNGAILFFIFAAAVVIYFISARNAMERETTIYSSMEEASLPLVYTESRGKEINCLRGYLEDMGNTAARESISVLPEDRALPIRIEEYGNTIIGIRYEIRNLSLDRLIERTELKDWQSADGSTRAVLPIQNLLTRDETYLLCLTVDTGERDVYYYTRIMWAEHGSYAEDMVDLADTFTRKSLDYEQAQDLTAYLETSSTEDNSSLGYVTIRASFNHFTWDGLDVELEGEPQITLQEYDGLMGQVQVKYKVRVREKSGAESLVQAEDNFTMKWNEQRIYMMNYERCAEELFTGDPADFSRSQILLGIQREDAVTAVKSPEGRFTAFTVNGNLWCYDNDKRENRLSCIFSFMSQEDDGIRSGIDQHEIKILSAADNGDIDFLVYGYMNRGKYEGRTGVVLYHFDREGDTVEERFFIPENQSFEKIQADIRRLSYVSPNGMIYLMLGGSVYGIDLNSNEALAVARGLSEGGFAVSSDGSRFAWQDAGTIYGAEAVHVIDFNTAEKEEIRGEEGDYVRVLGFVGNDLIYGLADAEDAWISNGRAKGLPMYVLYIVNSQMEIESEYRKEGLYVSDVSVEEGRVHLTCCVRLGDHTYMYQGSDTIVSNRREEEPPSGGIGWLNSQEKGKICYIEAGAEINTAALQMAAPQAFSYENAAVLDIGGPAPHSEDSSLVFYAYGGGHFLGASREFQDALELAYDKMGLVTDENQHILWDRVNRQSIRSISSPEEKASKITRHISSFEGSQISQDGVFLIDAEGCSLSQVLYFIDKGIPVIAYVESGSYLLLTGFDQYNVTLYDPETKESWKMGLGDGEAYFNSLQNDFICAIEAE